MDTTPENACAASGYVIGNARERTRVMAADILLDALFGSNEAPLKRALLDEGIAPDDLTYYGLEYRYVTEYVVGRLSYDEMFRQLEIAIHQFAKRQMTWFRGMERRGIQIEWVDPIRS